MLSDMEDQLMIRLAKYNAAGGNVSKGSLENRTLLGKCLPVV